MVTFDIRREGHPLMPRPLVLLAAHLLLVPALGAQGQPARTVYAPRSPLFYVAPGQPLYCAAIAVEDGHRSMGIARMFQWQAPLSAQTGLLGLAADSSVRYLMVTVDQRATFVERLAATVHFRRDGTVEIGRQSWEQIRADTAAPPRTVHGLAEHEGPQALALARELASRCR